FLQDNKGNLFESFIDIFRLMLTEFQEQDNLDFFRNAFLNMNYKMEEVVSDGFNNDKLDERLVDLKDQLDWDLLNINHQDEVKHIVPILVTVTTYNLMQCFAKKVPYDEAIDTYTFEINLLKSGLHKQQEDE